MTTTTPVNVVVGIGHDGSPDPALYALGVQGIIAAHGKVDAIVDGISWSAGWGDEPATWLAATFRTIQDYNLARASILALARAHEQDAVAFTVGRAEVLGTGLGATPAAVAS